LICLSSPIYKNILIPVSPQIKSRTPAVPIAGESTKETVKTIARGMPGDFRCDRGDYARVLFYFAREAAGAASARHSLRPLSSEGRTFMAKLARMCGEIAKPWLWTTLLFEN
jgi:hypothetical protein